MPAIERRAGAAVGGRHCTPDGTLSRMTAPSARHLAGVALVSATLLMTELALTRIFSVVMYYHFAFLAISIALFGLSASGVFAYVARATARPVSDRHAAGDRSRSSTPSRTIVALFVLVRLRVGLNYSPQNLALMLDDLRAGRAAVLHRRPRHHAGDLAAVGADQRRLRRRSDRRRRAAAWSSSRCSIGSARRASCWRRRRCRSRAARAVRAGRAAARASPALGALVLARAARGPALRRRRLRRRRHQGPPGRPRALQQVEFVLAHRRLRARRTATGR